MPIEFACPECHRRYQVKDELAGKGAKCGKCGHRMRIPALETAAAVVNKTASATKAPQAVGAAKASPPAPPQQSTSSASWLDEELEAAQPVVASARRTVSSSCAACGASLASSAVLCVSCGYDTRSGAKHETRHAAEAAQGSTRRTKRGKLAGAASLLRGTLFSFIAAVLGAIVWAALAYATMREFGLVAWALGGLAGFGMALGHDDDDGTIAGIIAAFMSLFGIIAAKVLIIVIFIGAAVGAMIGELDLNENMSGLELQREFAALAIAQEKMEEDGVDVVNATEEQWDHAMEAARAEVAGLSESELEKRMEQIGEKAEQEEDAPQAVVAQQAAGDDEAALVADDDQPGFMALLFEMFSPMDGLFILLAFFTAYKVGSGQIGD